MRVGSEEHKQLFCNEFIGSYLPFEPADLPWPELDEMSLARLRAIPVWTMALEVEQSAGKMLYGFAETEPDPLVRKALELQAFEEDRHGRLLSHMIAKYGLKATPDGHVDPPTRAAFVDFGYNECVDSFAGFGIFKLACDARLMPESLTNLFARVLVEEARHIVFFINWIAYDRVRRGYGSPLVAWLPTLLCYASAIVRRVKGGAAMGDGESDGKLGSEGNETIDLFGAVMDDLTPAKFILTCIQENDRYMREFDPRLLRPRVIPALAKFALAVIEFIEKLRAFFSPPSQTPKTTPGDA